MIYLIYLICGLILTYYSQEKLQEGVLEHPMAKELSPKEKEVTFALACVTLTLMWGVFFIIGLFSIILGLLKGK